MLYSFATYIASSTALVTDHDANFIVIFTQSGEFIQTINSYHSYAITISLTGYLITGHYGVDNKITPTSVLRCLESMNLSKQNLMD